MKFNLTLLGTLSNEIVYNTISFAEPWITAGTNISLVIGREIVRVRAIGNTAVLLARGVYNTTIRTHVVGTEVFLLTVDSPLVLTDGVLNSELYPFALEDLSVGALSISGIDYVANNYTYGSLVSLAYPVESDLADLSTSNISANVVALPAPTIEEDAALSYSVTDISLVTVVKRGYNDDEQAGLGVTVTDISKVNVVNTTNTVVDGTGADAILVSGSMAVTAIDTTYEDGTGATAVLVSGSLS